MIITIILDILGTNKLVDKCFLEIDFFMFTNLLIDLLNHFSENSVIDRQSLKCLNVPNEFETNGTPNPMVFMELLQTSVAEGVSTVDKDTWQVAGEVVLFFA